MGMTIKQRVKVNAALSYIYAQGFDAQTVVAWAKEYQRMGHTDARAFQQAINDFIGGQPDAGATIGKLTRLVEASDVPTVAKYDTALSSYIATGDDSALVALAPIIAQDSVALAAKHGELEDRSLTGEAVEAALGFAMADDLVTAAATPAAQPDARPEAPQQAQQQAAPQAGQRASFAFKRADAPQAQSDPTASQVSPFAAGGYVANGSRWDATPRTGQVAAARGLLAGHRVGNTGLADWPADQIKTKAEVKAQYVNQGAKPASEAV